MYQPTNEELREVARKLAISHAKREDNGHLDIALYIPLNSTMNQNLETDMPTIGLVEVVSNIPYAHLNRIDDKIQIFDFQVSINKETQEVEIGTLNPKTVEIEIESKVEEKCFKCEARFVILRPEEWSQVNEGGIPFPEEWDMDHSDEVYSAKS